MPAMRRSPNAVAFLVALVGGACSREAASALPPGKTHADAPEHPCTWFTAAEIGARIGVAVGDGRVDGPLGTSCRWEGRDDRAAFVQLQVVRDVSFWSVPRAQDGFEALAGIGVEAFVVGGGSSWQASARLERAFVTVVLGGVANGREAAQRLLTDVVPRVR